MLSRIIKLVNRNRETILLALIVFLASLFAFSLIWLLLNIGHKPIKIY